MADPESALLSGALSFDVASAAAPRTVTVEREQQQLDGDDWDPDDCVSIGATSTGEDRESDVTSQSLAVDSLKNGDSARFVRDNSKLAVVTRAQTAIATGSVTATATATATAFGTAVGTGAGAGTQTPTKTRSITLIQIHAPQLFDPLKRVLVPKQVVWVDKRTGVIVNVSDEAAGEGGGGSGSGRYIDRMMMKTKGGRGRRMDIEIEKIELGEGTVLMPGLVDVHVHLFLHPYTETPWTQQLTGESLAERVIRATVHARRTVMSGFTCVRDLGTEGAHDADLALRSSMAGRTPIIPGPRYYCATRAIVASGAYGPKNAVYPDRVGVEGIVGAVSADGVDSCVREVRRQIGMGADWVKIYADYTPLLQTPLSAISPSLAGRTIPTFTREEMKAMIDAAHRWGVKIAAHANSAGAVREVVGLGVDSVEHGSGIVSGDAYNGNDNVLRELARAGGKTVWVPTLAAYYTNSLGGTKRGREMWEMCVRTFRRAVDLELDDDGREMEFEEEREWKCKSKRKMDNIAVGGDTGVFEHGRNGLEIVLMRRLGAEWERVLAWATIGGWRCVRGIEWEGEQGREKVKRAEEVARRLWGDVIDDNNDDGGDDDDEEVITADLERGTPFGAIRAGWAADLVAVKGKVDGTPDEFESAVIHGVDFVMKGGVVYKRDGKEVVVG